MTSIRSFTCAASFAPGSCREVALEVLLRLLEPLRLLERDGDVEQERRVRLVLEGLQELVGRLPVLPRTNAFWAASKDSFAS